MTKKPKNDFIELVVDPRINFGGASRSKGFAQTLKEVCGELPTPIHTIIYFDQYMASSIARDQIHLELIEEIRIKFESRNVVLIGDPKKGSFLNMSLPTEYKGCDHELSDIHDRFILLMDDHANVITGLLIGTSINAVLGSKMYNISRMPIDDCISWHKKLKNSNHPV